MEDKYEKLEKVGEGNYGKVYKYKGKQSGQLVALKKTRLEMDEEGIPPTTSPSSRCSPIQSTSSASSEFNISTITANLSSTLSSSIWTPISRSSSFYSFPSLPTSQRSRAFFFNRLKVFLTAMVAVFFTGCLGHQQKEEQWPGVTSLRD